MDEYVNPGSPTSPPPVPPEVPADVLREQQSVQQGGERPFLESTKLEDE